MPMPCRSTGTLPAACTASQCTSAPALRAMRTTSAMGCSTPVSLLANITDTSAGSSDAASLRSSAARSSTPSPSTGTMSASGTARCTLSCSMDEISTRRRPLPASAMLLASVPPEVKITSAGNVPTRAATWRRALSTRPRALRPTPCTADGLPPVRNASTMASSAMGLSGLVALWSRYTDAGITKALAGGGHRGVVVGRGSGRLGDTRRQTALEHVEQGHRAQEGVDLVAQLLPQVVRQALAAVGAAAGGAHLGAARRLDRLVDRQDDFRDPRLGRAARQAIAAARTAHALHQAGATQAGKKLLQI